MNDDQRLLVDMADELFASLGHEARIETEWSAITDVGLPLLLLPESKNGFGGSWDDAFLVFRLAGYHALSLPVAEAALAAALAGRDTGRGTIASLTTGTFANGRFTGTLAGICQGTGAQFLVAPGPNGNGSLLFELQDASFEAHGNIAGEMRERLVLENAPARQLDADVFALGALARVAQIAGAMDAALARSVAYANERQQFGRPLAKFQAVQQNLATFACEAAAANSAAMGAAQAMTRRHHAPFEIAAAKLRGNRAVGTGTALAHQVHGAIGFTQEFPLHPLTRRMWSWRSEFGNDAVWSERLAGTILARGADNFWPDLTALTG